MRILPLTLSLLALLAPSSAQATSLVPLPPVFPKIVRADCPGTDRSGCYEANTNTIYLSPEADRYTKFHELGHADDEQVLTPWARVWFTKQFGFKVITSDPVRNWWRTPGQASPAEFYADAYAQCGMGITPPREVNGVLTGSEVSAYGYQPSWPLYRRVCGMITVLGTL